MNAARQRTLNVLAGVAFTLLGFVCYGTAGYLVFVPPTPAGETPLVDANTTDCQRTLTEIGLTSFKVGPELRVQREGLDNPERQLADASLGISACGLPLVRFCMGPGCQKPHLAGGVSFALSTRVQPSGR